MIRWFHVEPELSGCSDSDATAFITATGIVDTTIESAICQLVKDLKGVGLTPSSSNIWAKSFAIYPIVGATKTTTSYNLRNTSTFQMTWVDVGTGHQFTSDGVGNGGGANYSYGRTGFIPSTDFTSNTTGAIHYGFRALTSWGGGATNPIFGSIRTSPSPVRRSYVLATGGAVNAAAQNAMGLGVLTGSSAPLVFPRETHLITSQLDSNTMYGYVDGVADSTVADAGTLADLELYLMGRNINGALSGNDSTAWCQFGAITEYLTATEMADFWDAILRFQTTLGREFSI